MPEDLQNTVRDDTIVQEVHEAIEKVLQLDELRALALIRDILGQLSAIVADIAVLGQDPNTKERAQEEFHDLMIEISVLSMQLKDAQANKAVLKDLLAAAGVADKITAPNSES